MNTIYSNTAILKGRERGHEIAFLAGLIGVMLFLLLGFLILRFALSNLPQSLPDNSVRSVPDNLPSRPSISV